MIIISIYNKNQTKTTPKHTTIQNETNVQHKQTIIIFELKQTQPTTQTKTKHKHT